MKKQRLVERIEQWLNRKIEKHFNRSDSATKQDASIESKPVELQSN